MLRYAISDRKRGSGSTRIHPLSYEAGEAADFPHRHGTLIEQTHRLAAAKVDFFQLREKDLPASELATVARTILAILRETGAPTRLLINARPDIAIATEAHGVHLPSGSGELTPTQVRTLYLHAGLAAPIISKSCHSLADIHQAKLEKPDYILFSPIFEKLQPEAEPLPGIGLEALREACLQATPIAVIALGGLTQANSPLCVAAGAAGIAGIRLFQ